MSDLDETGQDVGFPGLKEWTAEIIDMTCQVCNFSLESLGIEVHLFCTRLEVIV